MPPKRPSNGKRDTLGKSGTQTLRWQCSAATRTLFSLNVQFGARVSLSEGKDSCTGLCARVRVHYCSVLATLRTARRDHKTWNLYVRVYIPLSGIYVLLVYLVS
jgi:hypothetical protein